MNMPIIVELEEGMMSGQDRADELSNRQAQLQQQIDAALERYGARVFDNIDLSQLSDVSEKARVVGRALIANGDARAFVLGRRLLEAAD